MKRLANMFAVAALALSLGAAAQPAPSQDASRILAFLFEVFHGRQAVNQAMLQETEGDPELRRLAEAAIARFDLDVLASELSVPLARSLSADETRECLAFIDTEAAAALMQASRRAGSASDLPSQFKSIPKVHDAALGAFFQSSCVKKTSAVLMSDEANQVSNRYGQRLFCEYARSSLPEMLATFQAHGHCADAPASGTQGDGGA